MIQVLGSSAYTGELRSPQSRGISPLFRGKISVGEASLRCYIKPMPDTVKLGKQVVENREVLSEALGYTLAKAANYAVPDAAGIIMLKREQIPESVLEHLNAITPGGLQQDYLAWFSQDMQHPSLLKRHIDDAPDFLKDLQLKRLAVRLAAHPETPAIVTFDEWTENSDRNLGNLLESADGKLTLIDHGRLFRLPIWQAATLSTSGLPLSNVIRELVDACTPHWSNKTPTKAARAMAYNSLAGTWRKDGQAAARQVLEEFLDSSDVTHVIAFLESRLEPAHYNKVVGLLI
ncbi:hypothetical protein SAMN04244573_02492 [Azotobacter beijerinckii]|uniref:Uncharacterized protein n=1 Tax=Azotobacter beijerinckii TaxID=170623 RepID=A0A1H9JUP6_9GAMM|nr:hypothetical protein [Azotobacter beijerinckii]SEQ90522.1 hypothetical protein SAMN04244573_02492 [Azotobacter beijerinckii]